MELIELVMHLAERGHYKEVHELITVPMNHCPDVLTLGLLQSPTNDGGPFRQEVLANLMPTFLGNHPNSATVLHFAWHTPVICGFLMKPLHLVHSGLRSLLLSVVGLSGC